MSAKQGILVAAGLLILVVGVWKGLGMMGDGGETATLPADAVVRNDPTDRSVAQVKEWILESAPDPKMVRFIEWGDVEKTETGYRVWVRFSSIGQLDQPIEIRRVFSFDEAGNITQVL